MPAPRLFAAERFADFGPARFLPGGPTPVPCRVPPGDAAKLLAAVKADAPKRPGVYGWLDRSGNLVYVGKAKELRTRLMCYFRPDSRDPKAGRILNASAALMWEESPTEFAALVRELELIQRHLPVYNVQGKPGRQRYRYVAVGRAPAPYAYAVTKPTGKEGALYGPLVGATRVEEAVRRLNHYFGLRDCSGRVPLAFAEQGELFPHQRTAQCLRYELGTCLGPCVRACTAGAYADAVSAARAFLEGRSAEPLERTRKEMEAAAASMEFERAAALRDKLRDLEWLVDRLSMLQHARQKHSFVFEHGTWGDRPVWYVVHRGLIRAACHPPRDAAEGAAVAATLQDAFARAEPPGRPVPAGQVDSVLLVSAWFRKHASDKAGLLTADEARRRCVVVGGR